MIIDPTLSALLGAFIGGSIGVVGTVISVSAASQRERKAFLRTTSQQHADRLRSTYELALNVLFNIARSGNPDRATYGSVFSQIALFGSSEVNALLSAYLASPTNTSIDLPTFVEAMKRHLVEVDKLPE